MYVYMYIIMLHVPLKDILSRSTDVTYVNIYNVNQLKTALHLIRLWQFSADARNPQKILAEQVTLLVHGRECNNVLVVITAECTRVAFTPLYYMYIVRQMRLD